MLTLPTQTGMTKKTCDQKLVTTDYIEKYLFPIEL